MSQNDFNKQIVDFVSEESSQEAGKMASDLIKEVLSQDFSKQSADIVVNQVKEVASILENYLNKFDNAYSKFLRYNRVYNQASGEKKYFSELVKSGENFKNTTGTAKLHPFAQETKQLNQLNKTTMEFIEVFKEGQNILSTIRHTLTNQTIETEITIISDDNVYRVPLKELQTMGAVKTVLSTFGGRQTSVFSLAYEFDLSKCENELKEYLVSNKKSQKNEPNPYELIWGVKQRLIEARKYRTAYFDYADAEVYNYLQQRNLKILQKNTYLKLRNSAKRNQVSQLHQGDIGNIQDKLIRAKNTQVNYATFSMVRKNLEKLQKKLEAAASPLEIQNIFLQMFAREITKEMNDFDKDFAKDAAKAIKNKFTET